MEDQTARQEIQETIKDLKQKDLAELGGLKCPAGKIHQVFQVVEALLTDDTGAFVTDWATSKNVLKENPLHKLNNVQFEGLAQQVLDACEKVLRDIHDEDIIKYSTAAAILTRWAKCVHNHALKTAKH